MNGKYNMDDFPYFEDSHSDVKFSSSKASTDDTQKILPRDYQNVLVYEPTNCNDVQILIDYLKRKEPAIINLDTVDPAAAQRILDFTSGAIYALNGSVMRISGNIFLFSPEGVGVTVPYDISSRK